MRCDLADGRERFALLIAFAIGEFALRRPRIERIHVATCYDDGSQPESIRRRGDAGGHIDAFPTSSQLKSDGSAATSMQAMLLDDDCHSIDSVEVGFICWNELTRQPREGW